MSQKDYQKIKNKIDSHTRREQKLKAYKINAVRDFGS